jgi:protoporphyrinogen oxidase
MNQLSLSPAIAVIGAGIAGTSIARMLHDRGFSVILHEAHQTIGGLVRCSVEGGAVYHRVGGHVFNSKDSKVLEWFWSHFDREQEFVKAKRNAAVFLGGQYIPYPIELNLKFLDEAVTRAVVSELIELSRSPTSQRPDCYQSFGDFLAGNFGKTLADLYFLPYNNKIWKKDLFGISLDWLDGKLPMMNPVEILLGNIQSASDSMVHSSFYYPTQGGSQFIVNRLASDLPIKHVEIGCIELSPEGYHLNQDALAHYSSIVFTGDIRSLPDILSGSTLDAAGLTNQDIESIKRLDSNGTTTMLCECDANDYSWVYLPDSFTAIHRMIMTGNFSPANNPISIPDSRTTCTVEFSGYMSESQMAEEIGRLPFDPTPISYNYCPASYIMHGSGTAEAVDVVLRKLESIGIFLCGRFSQWQYFNMDAAIGSAMIVADKTSRFQEMH